MKFAPIATTLALSLTLAGCQNEPAEAPDITEVIPVDEATDTGTEGSNGDAQAETGEAAGIEPAAPATMESGSNADEGREIDPARTKLVPAD